MKRPAAALAAASLLGTTASQHQQLPTLRSSAGHCPPADLALLEDRGMLHSQVGQDRCLIQQYFPGVCGGRYLEVGALDGDRFSNTYAFYHAPELGWRGVNVEVDPTSYGLLAENRKNDIANVHAAVCSEESMVHYVPGKFKAVGGIWEFSTPEQRARWWPGMDSPRSEGVTPVRCTQLQNILDTAIGGEEYHYFDFMTLDVEGAELSALQGLDFARVGFGAIVIERQMKGAADDRDWQIQILLASVGYDRVVDSKKTCGFSDHWYVHRNFGEIYGEVRTERVREVKNLRG